MNILVSVAPLVLLFVFWSWMLRRQQSAMGGMLGGGGGGVVQPAGYIEIKGGETRYRPIVDPKLAVGAVLAGGFLLLGLIKRLRG